MFYLNRVFTVITVSVLIGSLTLAGCSSMPWSSKSDDEDLFFEEDFGSEFEAKSKEPASKQEEVKAEPEEDDFFREDKVLASTKPGGTSKSQPVPVAPDAEDFFFEDAGEEAQAPSKPQPKPAQVSPQSHREPAHKIAKESGVISTEKGFVSIDQKTDHEEYKVDVATLHKQQEELMFRVQELQKIVGNLEPRLAATQERMASVQKAGPASNGMNLEIETLKEEIVRLKNEISIMKRSAIPSQQAKLIQKTRPSRRYPKLSRTPPVYNEALAAYKAGKYDQSILLFQELSLKNPPENLKDNIHFWMGSNYMKLDMYDDAIGQFQTVLKQYPRGNKIHDARFMLGVCYQKKGDTGRALDALEVALKGNPPSEVRQKIEKHLMEIK